MHYPLGTELGGVHREIELGPLFQMGLLLTAMKVKEEQS